jgi:hypothetical protein
MSENSDGKPTGSPTRIIRKLKSAIINGYDIRIGDEIAFINKNLFWRFQKYDELMEHKVLGIYLMNDGKIYLDIGVYEDLNINSFGNDFIKISK